MWPRSDSIGGTVMHAVIATNAWRVVLLCLAFALLVRLRPWRVLSALARGRRG